ncbi:tryptophan-rich sensory protein [Actinomadura logoneensis]|uniref:Tryptophan-rich sensory protein n=1 Tax=Actinomadura logoneensis TaxID=2293572 RepID=A0A372JAZ3_9ACTN|nr:TspO/MBR family protein [Actinomadura logoneensis]RFU37185.1 tryptophan-rich sensory protein [Actinomadura logoneensis]
MRLIGRRDDHPRWKVYGATTAAVTATAALGAAAVDTDNDWYRSLAKPPWQPPSWTFGAVWTPLYVSIAWASGRALLKASGRERGTLAASLGVNLALNATWNHLFFGRRSPTAGVVGTALLDAANADLIRRTARVDATAAAVLVPYAAWCLFATALNTDIARRNRGGRTPGRPVTRAEPST